MRLIPSPALIKQSLGSHSWLGLCVGALMYLICLSGTIVVFYEEFERWEQPHISESATFDPLLAERAFNEVLTNGTTLTDHLFLTLPSQAIPRMTVATEAEGWFVNADGSLGEAAAHEWTHLVTNLHLYLHLPATFGMILVSALGAMLCGLIISGFLAHPKIFRDAFSLRLRGSPRLEQVDIHNRLSVWGAPFHLLIAVTGAYFGLALLILTLIAASSGKSQQEILATVFGDEPVLEQQGSHMSIATALTNMQRIAPEATPLYITVHGAGTPGQFMEISGRHAQRLIYSENYRFDALGNYLGKAGFSDGEAGKQAVYSVYRLHFGHFGGMPVKLLYGVLGLALTVVSVTGINIWLLRRKRRDWINPAWIGFVWGTPAALALSALTQTVFAVPSTGLFWLVILASMAYALWRNFETTSRCHLQATSAALLLVLLLAHMLRFGSAAFSPAALGINTAIAFSALVLAWLAWRQAAVANTMVNKI